MKRNQVINDSDLSNSIFVLLRILSLYGRTIFTIFGIMGGVKLLFSLHD